MEAQPAVEGVLEDESNDDSLSAASEDPDYDAEIPGASSAESSEDDEDSQSGSSNDGEGLAVDDDHHAAGELDGDQDCDDDAIMDSSLVAAGFNVYSMVSVCERLHTLDLGLTKHLVRWLSSFSLKKQLDEAARSIPHFPGLRHWPDLSNKLSAGSLQGRDFRNLLKILVVLSYKLKWKSRKVSTGSGKNKREFTLPADFSAKFTECVSLYSQFYESCIQFPHTEHTLARLEQLCTQFRTCWLEHVAVLSPSLLNFPKFHNVEHAGRQIKLFGAGDVCNVEVMESLHKAPMALYRRMNKQVT
jgi:hypothetical protein